MLAIINNTAIMEGYRGLTLRTTVSNTTVYLGGKRTSAMILGCIPDSLKSGGKEWIDDLICHKNYMAASYPSSTQFLEVWLIKT